MQIRQLLRWSRHNRDGSGGRHLTLIIVMRKNARWQYPSPPHKSMQSIPKTTLRSGPRGLTGESDRWLVLFSEVSRGQVCQVGRLICKEDRPTRGNACVARVRMRITGLSAVWCDSGLTLPHCRKARVSESGAPSIALFAMGGKVNGPTSQPFAFVVQT